jgi:hypothetical protein
MSNCPICRNEMTIEGAFKGYVSGDMYDVELQMIEDSLCENHWEELMDEITRYEGQDDEDYPYDGENWNDGEEDFL